MLILWPAISDIASRLWYDDRAPLVMHSSVPDSTVIIQGGVLHYTTTYSKRSACFPPSGMGEVSYKLTRTNDSAPQFRNLIYHFDVRREAKWPAGDNLTWRTAVPIPEDIPPGGYTYTASATYTCEGASRPLTFVGPTIPIVIVPR